MVRTVEVLVDGVWVDPATYQIKTTADGQDELAWWSPDEHGFEQRPGYGLKWRWKESHPECSPQAPP